ncbi:MAG: DUF4286 family protein [Paludibacter sp.]
MLIFNTTYKVSTAKTAEWIKWVKDVHIPDMTKKADFSKPQITRIVGSDDEHGTSYSVQFHIATMKELERWHMQHAADLQQNVSSNFGTEVLFFSTVLDIIE